DASLGAPSVIVKTNAQGIATAVLTVGTKAGAIVVGVSARGIQSQVTVNVVEEGETLSTIAERYGTTVEELLRLNDLPDPSNPAGGPDARPARAAVGRQKGNWLPQGSQQSPSGTPIVLQDFYDLRRRNGREDEK